MARQRSFGRPSAGTSFEVPFLYRVVRHPLYLGVLLGMWTTPVMSAGHLHFATAMTTYIAIGIHYEETDLVRTYGDVYRKYQARPRCRCICRATCTNACASAAIGLTSTGMLATGSGRAATRRVRMPVPPSRSRPDARIRTHPLARRARGAERTQERTRGLTSDSGPRSDQLVVGLGTRERASGVRSRREDAMTKGLSTRRLGRTRREVTTLGLGGQGSIQWPAEGIDPVAIIDKAIGLGITYLDTSNVYGPSQRHFGQALQRRNLVPGTASYDRSARERLFLATKTHLRSARRPAGARFRSDFSEGMLDEFKVTTAVDDVRRSLSLMFGDGKGGYPEGAYLDSIQFHNLNALDEVDMLFEGFDDPSPDRPWMGALAAMLDLREGENRTGCNPKREKLVRHIGITGHWNSAAHIAAIQRDSRRVIDTLLVTTNPSDGEYMGHRYNAIAVAKAAGMGVIGMKVFADAAYYHKAPVFSRTPADVYHQVGSEQLPSAELIRYALSVDGVSTVIIGVGHIDDDPARCQLEQNLAAAQLHEPLSADAMAAVEARVAAAGKHGANAYFQRKAHGLTAVRNLGAEADSPSPMFARLSVRISWDTAYAGAAAIDRYEVLRDDHVIGAVPHRPQYTTARFHFDDVLTDPQQHGSHRYAVRTVDAAGNVADSHALQVDPRVASK